MIDQLIFAYDHGRLRDFHSNNEGISRFFLNRSFSPPTEPPVCNVTREIKEASLTSASSINSNGTNNTVGTHSRTETNDHSGTVAQTVEKSHAAPSVAVETGRAMPLIKPAPDDELRLWLNAPLLARVCQTSWRVLVHLLYRIYFRFSVSGLEHVPAKGPLIIVSNHSSLLDFGSLIFALKKHKNTIYPLAARELFFNTQLRRWASRVLLNALPLDRESHFGECFVCALSVLQHGHSVIYFPEGERTNGVIKSFKHGIGLLAAQSGVPVLPAYISGAFKALPRGTALPRPYRVHVRFGEPVIVSQIATDESPSEVVRRVTVDVQHAVEVLSRQPTKPSRD